MAAERGKPMAHVKGHYREAFVELIETGSVEEWDDDGVDYPAALQALRAELLASDDFMPGHLCDELDVPRGTTYAEAVQLEDRFDIIPYTTEYKIEVGAGSGNIVTLVADSDVEAVRKANAEHGPLPVTVPFRIFEPARGVLQAIVHVLDGEPKNLLDLSVTDLNRIRAGLSHDLLSLAARAAERRTG
jgi:hypothetical protein